MINVVLINKTPVTYTNFIEGKKKKIKERYIMYTLPKKMLNIDAKIIS